MKSSILILTFLVFLPFALAQQRQDGPGGHGGWMAGMGTPVTGTVTETAAEHLMVRTDEGDLYKVFVSANTRIMKDREPIKAADLHVGDMVAAMGQVDTQAKTVGAVLLAELTPEQAKQAREARANYGKTWMGGTVISVVDTTITVNGIEGKPHTIAVDENTSFRKRSDSVTLADVTPGDRVRAQGTVKNGVFVASVLSVMQPRAEGMRPPSDAPVRP